MRKTIPFLVLSLVLGLNGLAQAQSTAFSYDLGGIGGLYSHSPDDPVSDFTFIGPPVDPVDEYDAIALDADSTGVLFTVDLNTNTMGTLDPTTAVFTTVAVLSGDFPAASGVVGMTIDTSTDIAYITDGDGLYTMDLTTGVTVLVSAQFTDTNTSAAVPGVFELATDSAGNFWAFDPGFPAVPGTDTLWSLDETTGDLTAVGVFGGGDANFSNNGMDWDPVSGRLFADVYTGGGTGSYGTWDTTTGVFTEILAHGSFPAPSTGAFGGPIACFGGTTFQVDFWNDGYNTWDTDPVANVTGIVQPTASLPSIFAMDFDADGSNLYGVNFDTGELGTIDESTGEFTVIAVLTGDIDGAALGLTADPTTGQMYVSDSDQLFTLDVGTADTVLVGTFAGLPLASAPETMMEVSFDSTGALVGFSAGTVDPEDRLWSINLTPNGAGELECTEIGTAGIPAGIGTFIQGMDHDPADNALYSTFYDATAAEGFYGVWDLGTGTFTTIAMYADLPPDVDFYQFKLAIKEAPSGPFVVTPESVTTTRGSFIEGDLAEISASDNQDYRIQRSNADTLSRTEIEIEATSPVAAPTSLTITLEGAVFARTNVVQTISLFNFTTGDFDIVDSQNARRAPNPDSVVTAAAGGTLSDYVQPVTGTIRASVLYQSDNRRQRFTSNTDHFFWTIN